MTTPKPHNITQPTDARRTSKDFCLGRHFWNTESCLLKPTYLIQAGFLSSECWLSVVWRCDLGVVVCEFAFTPPQREVRISMLVLSSPGSTSGGGSSFTYTPLKKGLAITRLFSLHGKITPMNWGVQRVTKAKPGRWGCCMGFFTRNAQVLGYAQETFLTPPTARAMVRHALSAGPTLGQRLPGLGSLHTCAFSWSPSTSTK